MGKMTIKCPKCGTVDVRQDFESSTDPTERGIRLVVSVRGYFCQNPACRHEWTPEESHEEVQVGPHQEACIDCAYYVEPDCRRRAEWKNRDKYDWCGEFEPKRAERLLDNLR